ncbi:hypothetical protein JXB28_02750 [Candidatus Woesearchaeota archaeon]|nr:hypothetical protein [Candidatus Woesearchaeota archaeon]
MKILIGITVDLNNYEDYFKRFNNKYGCSAIEFHLLEKDLGKGFHEKLKKVKGFIKANGIRHVSFHSPDRVLQSVLFEEKSAYLEADKEKLMLLMDSLKKLADDIGQEIIMVFHQGIKLPSKEVDSMTSEELAGLRKLLLKKAKQSYDWLMSKASGSKLSPMLENSPPMSAGDGNYHVLDMAFEDMEERIGNNGFVLDISHAAMCIEYYKQSQKQGKISIPALDVLKGKSGKIPESLHSLESYVTKAKHNIKWIHISDANGIMGENEGLPIGAKGSIIDFKSLLRCIEKEIKSPIGVLEIANAHKDYSLIGNSMDSLLKING